jgi:hypothetical protein
MENKKIYRVTFTHESDQPIIDIRANGIIDVINFLEDNVTLDNIVGIVSLGHDIPIFYET